MKITETKSTNRLIFLLVAGSLFLLLGACVPSDKNQAQSSNVELLDLTKNSPFNIINGYDIDTTNDSFSYSIVALYDNNLKSLCTGSIIDKNYIVTAAHCMPEDIRNLLVVFGVYTRNAIQIMRASSGIAHENYSKAMEIGKKTKKYPKYNWGDIALVRIDQDLPPNYKPIDIFHLPSVETEINLAPASQPKTLIAGYGVFNGNDDTGSGKLRKTVVPFDNITYSETEASLNHTANTTGACRGDSGGPAYVKVQGEYVLWGVASRILNDRFGDCSYYSIYTKVSIYKDWIIAAQNLLSN